MQQSMREVFLDQVRQVIAEHGHAVQSVLGEGGMPDLCYTVGLTERNLPELAALGAAEGLAHVTLNVLAAALTPAMTFGGAVALSLPTGPARVMLAPVPDAAVAQLAVATALYGQRVRALQVAFAF
ncbi:DUF4262 domain-containing protein [Streptosporangium sp. NPDC002721]|uniref:DUF4262 domain-containing protein n=1 Tax=Streptosporangium sp. NPDC002721 TaxID=3366188 RepID=UPI00367AABE8